VPEISERDGLEAVYRPEVALVTARDRAGAALSSSSAPAVVASMLEALELRPGLRVLEVGAGTGYNAALIKRLVGEKSRVVSVDVDPDVARSDFVPLAWRDQLAEGGLVAVPFRFGGDPGTQAILGLRRDGNVLRSTTVFLGFFMTARPVASQPSLTVSTTSGAKSSTLARLSGRPLDLLSEAGRRRLVASAFCQAAA
jgi:protein-L-isoaspartate(D-aspartate) O-methyltransferase